MAQVSGTPWRINDGIGEPAAQRGAEDYQQSINYLRNAMG